MKKPYSLDHSIERDTDRLKAVEEILDTVNTTLPWSDIEQLASYILYGKDENGKNAFQRGECDDRDIKRYKTFKTVDEKVQSLDELLEAAESNELNVMDMEKRYVYVKKNRTIKKPKHDKDGNEIDPGDGDIPGMRELWDAIAHIEHTVAANEGEVEFNDDDALIRDPYRLWQLKHQLVDMRRHQYYLLESYKPLLHFVAPIRNTTPTYNFDSDSYYWMSREQWAEKTSKSYISKDINDYETRINEQTGEEEVKWIVRRQAFDWENPWHIKCLIANYSNIYMQDYDKLDSWGRTLIYDFDRYFNLCKFTPLREYILTRKMDKASSALIQQEIKDLYDVSYSEAAINTILNREIPEKMATMAKRIRLLKETPDDQRKVCSRCKRNLPIDPIFYAKNASKNKGVESACKECSRVMRKLNKGKEAKMYDQRRKDPSMFEMPPVQT